MRPTLPRVAAPVHLRMQACIVALGNIARGASEPLRDQLRTEIFTLAACQGEVEKMECERYLRPKRRAWWRWRR